MVGSILSNFWVSLIVFSTYFFSSYPFINGKSILINASMLAILFFLLTFLARALIAFIIENPVVNEEEIIIGTKEDINQSEASSEELAKIVKSMLKEE
ncbi:hypothetical protein [Bacillus sp. FJAT-22090]|uniref:hypothetical protein n=1 Tax=Bacillus sp. FJAT-22090 TaxID=1581038 RepID=UPI00119D3F0B|nr:hypothetical protein [Bacillus sp. FJAT-22090]